MQTIVTKAKAALLWAALMFITAASPAQQQIHESQVQNLVNDLASKGTITAAQQESYIYGDDIGTANAYAVTLTPAPTIVEGSIVVVKIANTNTDASTLSVNGSGVTTTTTVTTPPAPDPPPLPSGSTTVVSDHNLDDVTSGWKLCVVGNCRGGTPGGTSAPASYSLTFNNASPSTDGHSMLLTQSTQAGAHQTNYLVTQNSGSCPGCTWVHSHKRIYVDTTGGTPNNIEADTYCVHCVSSTFRMYGLQCNLSKHVWQITDDVAPWVSTPLSCSGFTMNAWHEIELVNHTNVGDTGCGGNGCLHYDWIAVDGVETAWNLVIPSDGTNNWSSESGDQFQCDIAGGSKTCKIYVDDAWFEAGTGTPPTGVISTGTGGGTGGGGGGTTTTTTTTGTAIQKQGASGLSAGDLVAGQIALFVFDGKVWKLLNPSSTVTSTGIGGSGTGSWFQEIPVGTLDGSNSDFYLSYTPTSPYVILTENGVTQDPYTRFNLSGNHIQMTIPPISTDEFVIWYFAGNPAGTRSGGSLNGTGVTNATVSAWLAYPNLGANGGFAGMDISFDGGTTWGTASGGTFPTSPFNKQLVNVTGTAPSGTTSDQVQVRFYCDGSLFADGATDQMQVYDLTVTINSGSLTLRPTSYAEIDNGTGTFSNPTKAYDADTTPPVTYGYVSRHHFSGLSDSDVLVYKDFVQQ